jgi:hypothetical protein
VSLITGVHGIAQQQLGRRQLQGPWQNALSDGLEKSCKHPVPLPPLDIAFYADLFLPDAKPGKAAKADSDPDELFLDDLDDEERADLKDAAAEMLTQEELAAAEKAVEKAYTRTPHPLQFVLRAMDQRFGASAGVLYLGELRQVRRYLCDPKLKKDVDALVDAAVGVDCRILIGHSLGSVVAWEYVRRYPEHELDLLLTAGSPLGLRMIRSRLPVRDFATAARPSHVAGWVNVRDPHDPVACAGKLSKWWPWSVDTPVNNQGDAHSATRYLGKRETGKAVLERAPELAGA